MTRVSKQDGGKSVDELLDELKERCLAEGLEATIQEQTDPFSEEDEPETTHTLIIQVPVARDKKELRIYEDVDLDFVASTEFEKYRYVDGYAAIWSQSLGFLECALDGGNLGFVSNRLIRAVGSRLGILENTEENDRSDESHLLLPPPNEDLEISIGPSSDEYSVLDGSYLRGTPAKSVARRRTIRIGGARLSTHDAARDLLLQLGNAVLFQIDLLTDIPLYLAQEKVEHRRRRKSTSGMATGLSAPAYQYDPEAMSLYWYARTADRMPLLQFLAYYQVVEFYFPVYTNRETQQLIRALVKDPRFSIDRDADLAGLLSAIRLHGGSSGFGEEKSQLRAAIEACTTATELRIFLREDSEREEFFKSDKARRLSKEKLSAQSPDADLQRLISERLYDIRCRIVHSKESIGDRALLLPFSREARMMQHDIALIEYIARKVIIAASRPLQI